MGRITDFVALGLVLLALYTLQFSAAVMLGDLYTTLTDDPGEVADMNGKEHMTDMREAITVWVPTIGTIGSIVIVAYREYRRQKITSQQAVGGAPPR